MTKNNIPRKDKNKNEMKHDQAPLENKKIKEPPTQDIAKDRIDPETGNEREDREFTSRF